LHTPPRTFDPSAVHETDAEEHTTWIDLLTTHTDAMLGARSAWMESRWNDGVDAAVRREETRRTAVENRSTPTPPMISRGTVDKMYSVLTDAEPIGNGRCRKVGPYRQKCTALFRGYVKASGTNAAEVARLDGMSVDDVMHEFRLHLTSGYRFFDNLVAEAKEAQMQVWRTAPELPSDDGVIKNGPGKKRRAWKRTTCARDVTDREHRRDGSNEVACKRGPRAR